MTANLRNETDHELRRHMLAQQIKTNELLRALLTQFQAVLTSDYRLDTKLLTAHDKAVAASHDGASKDRFRDR